MRYVFPYICLFFALAFMACPVLAGGLVGSAALEIVPLEVVGPTENAPGSDPVYPDADINPDPGGNSVNAFLPDTSSGLSGGYYFVCDCALGREVKFYIPSDFATGSLAIDSDGSLVNMTNTSIYLMPEDSRYQDYSIYAPRFGLFQYRLTSYDYSDLAIRNISETNICFMENTPQAFSEFSLYIVLIVILGLGLLLLVFGKR